MCLIWGAINILPFFIFFPLSTLKECFLTIYKMLKGYCDNSVCLVVSLYVNTTTGERKESVRFNEPAPVRWLTRGLGLMSHPKEGTVNSENKLLEFVCDCLNHHNDSCTKGCCRVSNLEPFDPKPGALTTRLSCSPGERIIRACWNWIWLSMIIIGKSISQPLLLLYKS